MIKKVVSILLITILVFSLSSCSPNGTTVVDEDKPLVAMVVDVNGFGYDPFNDAALAGLEKAKTDFNVDIILYEPNSVAEYEETMRRAAVRGADLVLSRGFQMADATKLVAQAYPKVKFAIYDYPDISGENIISVSFNEQEGSFLMGIIAAMTSGTNTLGFVGGMQFPMDERFEYGFKAGVKAIRPESQVLVNYIGSYSDESLAKIAALDLYQNGADVIYHSTDQFGTGIIDAAEEHGFWALGVGNQSPILNSSAVMASMTKEIDKAIYLSVQELAEGTLESGNRVYGIADGGIGVLDKSDALEPEVLETIEHFKELIRNNKIEVPYNQQTFEAFQIP